MSLPWTEKYRPRRVAEVVGNEEAKRQFEMWMRDWEKGNPSTKAALLVGPPGTGKTSLVLAYASEHGYDVVEINASDERSSEKLKTIVGESARQTTLSGTRRRIILLDEVDGIAGREAAGGIATLSSIIKSTRTPIVMVANDPWSPRLAPLRESALMIKFNKLRQREIVSRLKRILESEGVHLDEEILAEIARRSEGDMRSAINDAQVLISTRGSAESLLATLGLRDRQKTSFEVLAEIFGSTSAASGRVSVQGSDMEIEDIVTWVCDNILNQIHSPQAIADVFKLLADADLHYSRVKRLQRWELLRYVAPLLGAGPGVVKHMYGEKGVRFEFPSTIRFMQQTREQRALIQSALAKVAARTKMSRTKAASEMLPFLAEMLRRGEKGVARYFELSDEEVKALIGLGGRQPSEVTHATKAAPPRGKATRPRQTRGARRSP
ncbi:ATP-dependent zinc metalloprotease FtsH [Candidatus Calditenuaceae archaeon HR02]|nr:ATP-dependent zinc metalloprotease FtsH [Candidatus Calditenuaceae archaeon HR02]